jgi:glutamyl-tRNA reductase
MIDETDILITATSAPHLVIHEADIAAGKEIWIFDLAFPRDVEPSLADRDGVNLFDLERIEQLAKTNLMLRTREISRAEQIIEEEIQKYRAWEAYL